MRPSVICVAACAVAAALATRIGAGQNAPKLEFEVASIKPTAIGPGQVGQLATSGQRVEHLVVDHSEKNPRAN